MLNPLQFSTFTNYHNVVWDIGGCSFSPIMSWLLTGKIAENPVVTPSTSVQVITTSAKNRYLQSVTIEATA